MKTKLASRTDDEAFVTSALPHAFALLLPAGARATAHWEFAAAGVPSSAGERRREIGFTLAAVASFLAACSEFAFTPLPVLLYLFCLVQLSLSSTGRRAFYSGLAVGMFVAAAKLTFFWTIFSAGAIALWLVFAVWLGLFTAVARLAWRRLHPWQAMIATPVLWTGFEYFRSELYYLRFSWLSPGYAFGVDPGTALPRLLGVYGTGFLCAAVAAVSGYCWQRRRIKSVACLLAGAVAILALGNGESGPPGRPAATVTMAGVQLEFPTETEVVFRLNELVRRHPEAQLLVLPEYSLPGTASEKLKAWCRRNSRYLLVCGKDPAGSEQFRNTAWIIDPLGQIVFSQVKAVPIQFFKDGLAATKQAVWDSPWGKLGICICYDLSYTRVTDELIRQGARCLIVPTMDVVDWGKAQHDLHARIAPVRAREYGVPVFRIASSGISQAIDATGRQLATAPFGGDGRILSARLGLPESGRLPLDRPFAVFAVCATAALVVWFSVVRIRER